MSTLKRVLWPQIILFGDSITQANGWGSDLAHKLARKCDVVNRGLSGYNTRWAKIALPRILPASDAPISAITVFFGANDCALEDQNPQQHVPCMEYLDNLGGIVQYLVSAGISKDKIIFITPPPLQEDAWEKECMLKVLRNKEMWTALKQLKGDKGSALNRLNSTAGQYAQACVQAAGQCGVDVLDLWTLMQKDGQDFSVYLSDGLHLSEKGNQFVAEHLWTLLESRVAALPFLLPYWGDVDPKSPESSLLCD